MVVNQVAQQAQGVQLGPLPDRLRALAAQLGIGIGGGAGEDIGVNDMIPDEAFDDDDNDDDEN